ncbi:MAG: cation:proton antiporter [Candidatus Eisenbacteria bacterium]|nr:cation:proton antiporter [Candidatus Eisenbacteria bacterium]
MEESPRGQRPAPGPDRPDRRPWGGGHARSLEDQSSERCGVAPGQGRSPGPFGLRLVPSVHAIELLAEVGVVLLLFTIGLEFSLSRLRQIFRDVALEALSRSV